jgi:octaprenyl-diphosphate synthase
MVVDKGGIKYAQEKMYEYRDQAMSILDELPDGDAKNSLRILVNYTIEREK